MTVQWCFKIKLTEVLSENNLNASLNDNEF